MIRKSEDLPESCTCYASADRGIYDLEDRKGHPGSMKIGPGFFLPGPLINFFSRRRKMQKEQAHLKMTLLLINDWDGFQVAMREMMLRTDRREN
jgi:hypothetical protein